MVSGLALMILVDRYDFIIHKGKGGIGSLYALGSAGRQYRFGPHPDRIDLSVSSPPPQRRKGPLCF
jgi:hypothetical protein